MLWNKWKNIFLITRPLSNIKNIFMLFLAIYFSHLTNINFTNLFLAFLSLSLISSSIYTYNSYTDFNFDKENPVKKHHYLQIKDFGYKNTFKLFLFLLFFGLGVALYLKLIFFIWVLIYWLVNFLYSWPKTRFKEKIILDILFGGSLTYLLRFVSFWYLLSTAIPPLGVLILLFFLKTGTFILYKIYDKRFYKKKMIYNTFTLMSNTILFFITLLSFFISFMSYLGLCLNHKYINIKYFGDLNINFLWLLLFIPFLSFAGLVNLKTSKNSNLNFKDFKKLRTMVIIFSLLNLSIILLFIYIKKLWF